LFNKDYEKRFNSDPELFKIMDQWDHGENTAYEGWEGKDSVLIRNFIRYYVNKDTNKIVPQNSTDLDRHKYSLMTQTDDKSYVRNE
jgi:hypothetical protein